MYDLDGNLLTASFIDTNGHGNGTGIAFDAAPTSSCRTSSTTRSRKWDRGRPVHSSRASRSRVRTTRWRDLSVDFARAWRHLRRGRASRPASRPGSPEPETYVADGRRAGRARAGSRGAASKRFRLPKGSASANSLARRGLFFVSRESTAEPTRSGLSHRVIPWNRGDLKVASWEESHGRIRMRCILPSRRHPTRNRSNNTKRCSHGAFRNGSAWAPPRSACWELPSSYAWPVSR